MPAGGNLSPLLRPSSPSLRSPARRARRQLFLNFKGGTGKTTLSTAYAYGLAARGYRVLVLDLDGQAHATRCLGYTASATRRTLFDVLVGGRPLPEVIIASRGSPSLALVPSSLEMSGIDVSLGRQRDRNLRLRAALDEIDGMFDFVVIDPPPSFSLLNLNALLATTDLIIPVLPDFLSFDGVRMLVETLAAIERRLSHDIERMFLVVNGYHSSTKVAREAMAALQRHYPDQLLGTRVRACTEFARAASVGRTVCETAPESQGARDTSALIEEVLFLLRQPTEVRNAASSE